MVKAIIGVQPILILTFHTTQHAPRPYLTMSEYQHDLFISYAHIDNQPLGDRAQGWVTDLHHALEIRLSQLLGEQPKIWRDEKLGGADFFDDEIRDALTSAAAMLAILSPRYVRSDYCRLEVIEFLDYLERQGGLRVGNKSRLFKAIKTPIPLDEHPAAIQRLLGFHFFEQEGNGAVHEFDNLYGQEWGRKFWQTLEDLAQELAHLFRLMRTVDQPAPGAPGSGLTIYLAQTTYDLSEARDSIRRELTQRGHTMLPEQPLPLVGPEVEVQVAADLARSDLAIHLLGVTYGVVPEAAEQSVQEIENRLAAQRSREHGLPRLIWLPPGTTPTNARQRAFVETLHNEPAAQAGADLLETPLTELKTVLLDRLALLQQPPPAAAPPAANNDLTRIYLIYDEQDEADVAPLEDYLYQIDERVEIMRPLFGGDPSAMREEHEENLRICRAALLYFGRSDEAWLRAKLRDLRKAPGLGRQQPMTATGIYIAPPLDPRKTRFRSREVDHIIRSPNGFQRELLGDFLAQLALTSTSGTGAVP